MGIPLRLTITQAPPNKAGQPLTKHMTNMEYKGFELEYKFYYARIARVTFHHPDLEDGSGKWSGSASCMADALMMIDEMLED